MGRCSNRTDAGKLQSAVAKTAGRRRISQMYIYVMNSTVTHSSVLLGTRQASEIAFSSNERCIEKKKISFPPSLLDTSNPTYSYKNVLYNVHVSDP